MGDAQRPAGGLDTLPSFATLGSKMRFRSIQSIGIFALFFGTLFAGEASGRAFVYSAVDRTPSLQSENQNTAPLRVSRRPKMARIPNLNIYYAPDLYYNLYMADKRWYLLHNEKWYQGETHEGPWRYLGYSKVPEKLKKIPPEFIKKGEAFLPEKKMVAKKKPSKTPRKKSPQKSTK
jgi:hypothetical protein